MTSPAAPRPPNVDFDGARPKVPSLSGDSTSAAPPSPPVAPPAATLPEFPWPPPIPSSRQEIDRQLVVAGTATTLRAVADKIEAALKRARYEYSFYGVPNGFAVVARLERIDDEGATVAGDRRFLPPDAREAFDLTRYVSSLFFVSPGYYRMIALIVTDQPIVADGAPFDQSRAMRMPSAGATALPQSFSEQSFSPDHRVYALIYEFRKDANTREPQALVPGRLPARTHLSRSGVEPALGSGR